jgi:hypothetical protein
MFETVIYTIFCGRTKASDVSEETYTAEAELWVLGSKLEDGIQRATAT